jgi:hypothetical protein
MTLDDLVQQYAALPIPVSHEAVVQAAASALHRRFNVAARGIASLYEAQLGLRLDAAGQAYEPILKGDTEYFPLDLLKNNIGNNGTEASKWITTLQGHAKEYNDARLKAPSVQALRAQQPPSANVDTAGLPMALQKPETKETIARLRAIIFV